MSWGTVHSPAMEVDHDTSEELPSSELHGNAIRKKVQEVKSYSWLIVDMEGRVHQIEAEKHVIMQRTGLLARDIRILDPLLSYTSTILGHDRAIVIRLEHVKAIIMAQEVLLLDYQDPSVIPFVDDIQTRILSHYHAIMSQEAQDIENVNSNFGGIENRNYSSFSSKEDEEVTREYMKHGDGPKLLPFEFVALEACLEAAFGCLETEANTLELEALPALDKLTSEVSTLNLERVRQMKSRLVSITGRVQKVRDELENLLDDDQDMAEMFLTQKLREHADNPFISSSMRHDFNSTEIIDRNSIASNTDIREINHQIEQTSRASIMSSWRSIQSNKQINVEELERLLEPYFVQVGGILDRLSTLREYVDDTEDYISIMLDDMQNQMIRLGIMLVTAALVMNGFITITGIMSQNIAIPVYHDKAHGNRNMALLIVICTVLGFVSYTMFYFWFKRKGLLE